MEFRDKWTELETAEWKLRVAQECFHGFLLRDALRSGRPCLHSKLTRAG
jgi:hypothetical protein